MPQTRKSETQKGRKVGAAHACAVVGFSQGFLASLYQIRKGKLSWTKGGIQL